MSEALDDSDLLVGELHVLQYVDSNGVLSTVDLSQGPGGEELSETMYEHLIGWAQGFALAPKVAAILAAGDAGE